MSLQIGTDTTVSSMDKMGGDFVTKVDLSAWAPLCKVWYIFACATQDVLHLCWQAVKKGVPV